MIRPEAEPPSDGAPPFPHAAGGGGGDGTAGTSGSRALHLQPLTAALLECVTPADVVAAVVERGVAALGAEAGLVALLDRGADGGGAGAAGDDAPGQAFLQVVGASGYADELLEAWRRFPVADPLPLSDAVRGGAPLFSEGRADLEARYPGMFRRGPTYAVKASASLPLLARGRAIGGLHLSFPRERGFSGADREFLMELARQCALALDRALALEAAERARESAEHARRRLEFLARASALLGESLDYQTRLESLARLCVPEIADWAAVDVLGEDGRLIRLAVAHRSPEREAVMREVQERYPPDARGGQNTLTVIRTGERLFFPDIPGELIDARAVDAGYARLLKQVGLRAALSLPLTARERTLGALTLGIGPEPEGSGRSFSPETVALAEELARRAAVAMDNARLFRAAAAARDAEREARHQTDLVLDSIGEMFYALDPEFRFTYANRRAQEVWGKGAEDLLGRKMWEVFPQLVGTDSYRALTGAMRTRRAVRYETVSLVLRRWVECSAYPAEGGGMAVYFRDIHDKKEAEQALTQSEATLRVSEARYRRLLDTALEGVLFLDARGAIASANERFARMLGYDSPSALVGRPLSFLFFPEDEGLARDRWAARVQGVEQEYELRLRRADGAECWVIAHVSVERKDGGDFLGTFTLFTDITERREAQRELAARSDEVAAILESVTDAFFALDGEWRFTYVNHEAERVLLRRRGELVGRSIWEEFPAAVGSEFETQYRRAMRERVTVSFEAYYPLPLDSWYDVRAYPSVSGPGLSVYFRNVNEERRREEERERLLAEQARLVAELREASVRQRRFLREMLAGFTEGRLRLCFAEDELPAALAPLSDAVPLSETNLRLLRKTVEAVAEGLSVPKERVQEFETAVHEAAMNAVRHGGGGTARVRGDRDTGRLQVWVRDLGPGIAEDLIHRAVERGYTTGGFGQGFFYMQSCADRLYLLTGPGGTTVVLEQDRTPPEPAWLASPARP